MSFISTVRNGTFFLGLVACFLVPASADELTDRMVFWESMAFSCPDTGIPFPSKEKQPANADPTLCEDGDMTLFNGLFCAAGDERGCVGVRNAQDSTQSTELKPHPL